MKFNELGLSKPLLKAVAEQGYDIPSPIQDQAIPAVLSGKDVMAAAQTGTGKTAGFTLPILELLNHGRPPRSNSARTLILTPTRELAAQVEASVKTYGQYMKLRSAVVFGGVKINPQMQKLRRGVDVLVATPGRLLDLYSQNAVRFDDLEILVLDEADRMLDMGFIHDIKRILRLLPSERQNLMFSATFSDEIRKLAKKITKDPIEISISPEITTAEKVSQVVIPVDQKRKKEVLRHLVSEGQWEQVLVFCRTKHGSNKLSEYLNKSDITSLAIHGNKSQGARTRALAAFKKGEVRVLVATDIAARGIDIDLLPHVVNFDLPNVPEDYVHRIGRTGRAGADGIAMSLVSVDEASQLFGIERLLGHPLEREYIEGYEPQFEVAESRRGTRGRTSSRGRRPDNRRGRAPSRSGGAQSDRETSHPPLHNEPNKKKKPKKPKKRPFVKAAVKEKWANRSEEENQAARERSRQAKQGQRKSTASSSKQDDAQSRSHRKSSSQSKGSSQSKSGSQGKGSSQGKSSSNRRQAGKAGGDQSTGGRPGKSNARGQAPGRSSRAGKGRTGNKNSAGGRSRQGGSNSR